MEKTKKIMKESSSEDEIKFITVLKPGVTDLRPPSYPPPLPPDVVYNDRYEKIASGDTLVTSISAEFLKCSQEVNSLQRCSTLDEEIRYFHVLTHRCKHNSTTLFVVYCTVCEKLPTGETLSCKVYCIDNRCVPELPKLKRNLGNWIVVDESVFTRIVQNIVINEYYGMSEFNCVPVNRNVYLIFKNQFQSFLHCLMEAPILCKINSEDTLSVWINTTAITDCYKQARTIHSNPTATKKKLLKFYGSFFGLFKHKEKRPITCSIIKSCCTIEKDLVCLKEFPNKIELPFSLLRNPTTEAQVFGIMQQNGFQKFSNNYINKLIINRYMLTVHNSLSSIDTILSNTAIVSKTTKATYTSFLYQIFNNFYKSLNSSISKPEPNNQVHSSNIDMYISKLNMLLVLLIHTCLNCRNVEMSKKKFASLNIQPEWISQENPALTTISSDSSIDDDPRVPRGRPKQKNRRSTRVRDIELCNNLYTEYNKGSQNAIAMKKSETEQGHEDYKDLDELAKWKLSEQGVSLQVIQDFDHIDQSDVNCQKCCTPRTSLESEPGSTAQKEKTTVQKASNKGPKKLDECLQTSNHKLSKSKDKLARASSPKRMQTSKDKLSRVSLPKSKDKLARASSPKRMQTSSPKSKDTLASVKSLQKKSSPRSVQTSKDKLSRASLPKSKDKLARVGSPRSVQTSKDKLSRASLPKSKDKLARVSSSNAAQTSKDKLSRDSLRKSKDKLARVSSPNTSQTSKDKLSRASLRKSKDKIARVSSQNTSQTSKDKLSRASLPKSKDKLANTSQTSKEKVARASLPKDKVAPPRSVQTSEDKLSGASLPKSVQASKDKLARVTSRMTIHTSKFSRAKDKLALPNSIHASKAKRSRLSLTKSKEFCKNYTEHNKGSQNAFVMNTSEIEQDLIMDYKVGKDLDELTKWKIPSLSKVSLPKSGQTSEDKLSRDGLLQKSTHKLINKAKSLAKKCGSGDGGSALKKSSTSVQLSSSQQSKTSSTASNPMSCPSLRKSVVIAKSIDHQNKMLRKTVAKLENLRKLGLAREQRLSQARNEGLVKNPRKPVLVSEDQKPPSDEGLIETDLNKSKCIKVDAVALNRISKDQPQRKCFYVADEDEHNRNQNVGQHVYIIGKSHEAAKPAQKEINSPDENSDGSKPLAKSLSIISHENKNQRDELRRNCVIHDDSNSRGVRRVSIENRKKVLKQSKSTQSNIEWKRPSTAMSVNEETVSAVTRLLEEESRRNSVADLCLARSGETGSKLAESEVTSEPIERASIRRTRERLCSNNRLSLGERFTKTPPLENAVGCQTSGTLKSSDRLYQCLKRLVRTVDMYSDLKTIHTGRGAAGLNRLDGVVSLKNRKRKQLRNVNPPDAPPSLPRDTWLHGGTLGNRNAMLVFRSSALANPSEASVHSRPGHKLHITYRVVQAETRLLAKLLECHGICEAAQNSNDFNLLWTGSHPKPGVLRSMAPHQRVNHFPRSYELTRKDRLYKNIEKMQHAKGLKHFDFIPQTFLMPTEYKDLCSSHHRVKGPWIVKPAASSRGRGIYIVESPNQVPLEEPVVVAKYISKPLLVKGHKCDLRLYVAVTAFDPLIVYIYEEGMVRFATVKYDTTHKQLWNPCMHLCNYSINKYHSDYVKSDDPSAENVGHKWTLSALLRHLKSLGKDTGYLMSQVEDLVVKAILACGNSIITACKMFVPNPNNCFELYGFDILIDENLKPWLLEVNLSPSLGCDSPLDVRLKSAMLSDLLTLVGIPAIDPILRPALSPSNSTKNLKMKLSNCRRVHSADGLSNTLPKKNGTGSVLSNMSLTAEDFKMVRNAKTQFERRGGFVRIFPAVDSWTKYSQYLEPLTGIPIAGSNSSLPFTMMTQHNYNQILYSQLFPDVPVTTPILRHDRYYVRHPLDRRRDASLDSARKQEVPIPAVRQDRYERKLVQGHRSSLSMPKKQLKESHSNELKRQISDMIKSGKRMSQVEARRAFSQYLTCVLKRISASDQDGLVDIVLKFLQKASTYLKSPFGVKIPSHKLSEKDRAAVVAKQLNDFLYLYNRETDFYGELNNSQIPKQVFTEFLEHARESDLEEVLILQNIHTVPNKGSQGTSSFQGLLRCLPNLTGSTCFRAPESGKKGVKVSPLS